jgi:hypothetical protein
MNEIKAVLSILKARWSEAALIIGLMAIPMPLMRLLFAVYPVEANRMILINWGILLTNMCISLFVLLIGGGFLRTVYLEGQKRQRVSSLMKTGRHFFSRLFGLYAGVMMLAIIAIYLLPRGVVCRPNFFITNRIVTIAIKLILVKPILLVPAMIIVLDCELFEGFGFIRRMRLLDAKGMLAVFLILVFLPLFFPNLPAGSLWHYPIMMLFSILVYGLSLAVMIMAVRFAGSVSRDIWLTGQDIGR